MRVKYANNFWTNNDPTFRFVLIVIIVIIIIILYNNKMCSMIRLVYSETFTKMSHYCTCIVCFLQHCLVDLWLIKLYYVNLMGGGSIGVKFVFVL